MSKIKTLITFAAGLIVGGAAAWHYAEKKYADLADQEIDSVKKAYANLLASSCVKTANDASEHTQEKAKAPVTKATEKETAAKTSSPPPFEPAYRNVEMPYVITPEEFGELDYTTISLLYFEDGVLADEYGVIIDDVDEIVGDGLEHFGEYEEDSVYVRSDAKRCDYEILMDLRTYEEFRKTLPTNI